MRTWPLSQCLVQLYYKNRKLLPKSYIILKMYNWIITPHYSLSPYVPSTMITRHLSIKSTWPFFCSRIMRNIIFYEFQVGRLQLTASSMVVHQCLHKTKCIFSLEQLKPDSKTVTPYYDFKI